MKYSKQLLLKDFKRYDKKKKRKRKKKKRHHETHGSAPSSYGGTATSNPLFHPPFFPPAGVTYSNPFDTDIDTDFIWNQTNMPMRPDRDRDFYHGDTPGNSTGDTFFPDRDTVFFNPKDRYKHGLHKYPQPTEVTYTTNDQMFPDRDNLDMFPDRDTFPMPDPDLQMYPDRFEPSDEDEDSDDDDDGDKDKHPQTDRYNKAAILALESVMFLGTSLMVARIVWPHLKPVQQAVSFTSDVFYNGSVIGETSEPAAAPLLDYTHDAGQHYGGTETSTPLKNKLPPKQPKQPKPSESAPVPEKTKNIATPKSDKYKGQFEYPNYGKGRIPKQYQGAYERVQQEYITMMQKQYHYQLGGKKIPNYELPSLQQIMDKNGLPEDYITDVISDFQEMADTFEGFVSQAEKELAAYTEIMATSTSTPVHVHHAQYESIKSPSKTPTKTPKTPTSMEYTPKQQLEADRGALQWFQKSIEHLKDSTKQSASAFRDMVKDVLSPSQQKAVYIKLENISPTFDKDFDELHDMWEKMFNENPRGQYKTLNKFMEKYEVDIDRIKEDMINMEDSEALWGNVDETILSAIGEGPHYSPEKVHKLRGKLIKELKGLKKKYDRLKKNKKSKVTPEQEAYEDRLEEEYLGRPEEQPLVNELGEGWDEFGDEVGGESSTSGGKPKEDPATHVSDDEEGGNKEKGEKEKGKEEEDPEVDWPDKVCFSHSRSGAGQCHDLNDGEPVDIPPEGIPKGSMREWEQSPLNEYLDKVFKNADTEENFFHNFLIDMGKIGIGLMADVIKAGAEGIAFALIMEGATDVIRDPDIAYLRWDPYSNTYVKDTFHNPIWEKAQSTGIGSHRIPMFMNYVLPFLGYGGPGIAIGRWVWDKFIEAAGGPDWLRFNYNPLHSDLYQPGVTDNIQTYKDRETYVWYKPDPTGPLLHGQVNTYGPESTFHANEVVEYFDVNGKNHFKYKVEEPTVQTTTTSGLGGGSAVGGYQYTQADPGTGPPADGNVVGAYTNEAYDYNDDVKEILDSTIPDDNQTEWALTFTDGASQQFAISFINPHWMSNPVPDLKTLFKAIHDKELDPLYMGLYISNHPTSVDNDKFHQKGNGGRPTGSSGKGGSKPGHSRKKRKISKSNK